MSFFFFGSSSLEFKHFRRSGRIFFPTFLYPCHTLLFHTVLYDHAKLDDDLELNLIYELHTLCESMKYSESWGWSLILFYFYIQYITIGISDSLEFC